MIKILFTSFIIILLYSCNNDASESENNPKEVDYNSICQCINSIDFYISTDNSMLEVTECIKKYSLDDKKLFFEVLNKSMLTCPDFVNKINDYELHEKGFDTIKFEPLSDEECAVFKDSKWKDIRSKKFSHSVSKGDSIYQYESNNIVEVWFRIKSEGCRELFIVKRKLGKYNLPPNLGDTVSYQYVGKKDTLIKSILEYRGFRLTSIIFKIE